MPNNNDLWPQDLVQDATIRTPVAVLREQAAFLGEHTKKVITAEVTSTSSGDYQSFVHSLRLIAAALGNYRYELLKVSHSLLLYPVMLTGEKFAPRRCANESELRVALGDVFTSDDTRKIINALIAQSNQAG